MSAPSSFFTSCPNNEQREWSADLASRIDISKQSNTAICLLDTGVNNGHPLLEKLLNDSDKHAIHPEKGANDNLEELYGDCTSQAISLSEIENPNANRVICLATTAPDTGINDGRPSSWSGALDALTSSADEDDNHRLIIISAGNTSIEEVRETKDYRAALINHPVESPAQSWNSVTVGAFTEKQIIYDKELDGYSALAQSGEISPYSSSSHTWNKKWPIKPDIVLEGGNLAYNEKDDFYSEADDLSLLTTGFKYHDAPFDVTRMTSSATAQGSWIAANIMHEYPNLWPETIRALMIHSADWTPAMKKAISQNDSSDGLSRRDYTELVKECGYGVPSLDKAIWSASNSVNMIIEDELQPFLKKDNASIVLNEMHIHTIPWPEEILLSYGKIPVKMKITLSYFIEPGPGEIGWKDKYRYPSCGLCFDVNNETEDKEQFVKRISKAMREEDESGTKYSNDSTRWLLGSQLRNRGSIHSDIWEGTAAELSNSNYIIIFPTTGWWKTRTNLKKYQEKVRYSLVVSIETPELELDLYSSIQSIIKNKTLLKTEITAF